MQGKATIKGHPIHPMLVSIPIGCFVAVLVSDIISIWGDATFWPVVALWLIAFGVVGALLAAVFGFTDYLTAPMSPEAKRTATMHMIVNLIAVAFYVAAFAVRFTSGPTVLGYVLTYVGLALLGISGWLGGHLVYVDHVGTALGSPYGKDVDGRIVGVQSERTTVR